MGRKQFLFLLLAAIIVTVLLANLTLASPPSVNTLPATGVSSTAATLNGEVTALGKLEFVAVAGGAYHSLLVRSDGTLWASGYNTEGQLGLGDTDDRWVPTQVGIATNWVAAAAGEVHSLGLRSDGTLWAWGANWYGQLGLADTTERLIPTQVGTDTNWVAVAAGQDHSLGVRSDGTLWAWGLNNYGQLGLNDTNNRLSPTQVGTDTNWVAVASGEYYDSLGMRSDGTLWAWGLNNYGQLGLNDTNNRLSLTQVVLGPPSVSFEWGLTTSYGNTTTPQTMTVTVPFSANISGLTPSATYHFRAKAVGDGTAYGDDMTFNTLSNRPPNQPGNVSPADGATGVSLTPTLQSSAFSDPDTGDSQAASQWQITAISGDYSSAIFDSGSASVPSGVLDYSNTYYWRVRYQDNHGTWSPWSVETSFITVNRQPDQPVNSSPANGTSGVSLTSTLQSSAFHDPDAGDTHAASQWQITTISSNYLNPVFDSGTDNLNLTQLTLPLGILNGNTTYYWRVCHQDNHGAWSDWSVDTSFTTMNRLPNQPTNISPTNGATGVSVTPTLKCSAFSDPDSGDTYGGSQWQITMVSGNYTNPVFDSGSGTEITLSPVILNRNTTYYWHVRHQDNHGAWSSYSAETSFTTSNDQQPNQPGNVSPTDGATGVTLTPILQSSTFSDPDAWDTHAASRWQITTLAAGNYATSLAFDNVTYTNLTSIVIPSGTLSYSTTYYWHVSYEDNYGAWSSYSAETSFTTQAAPNNPPNQPSDISPSNGATGISLTPTLQSTAFSDPDAGDIHAASQWQVRTTSGSYSGPVYDSGTDGLHPTSINIAGGTLNYSNTYYWHVRHQDNHGTWSEWSAEASFTTLSREPNQPVNALPANGATAVSRTLGLQSSAFSDPDAGDTHGASQWQVTSTAGDYSAPVFDSDIDAGHLTRIGIPSGVLQCSNTYYWRVRYQDSHGVWSDWSADTSFTTATQPQAGFSVTSVRTSEGVMLVFFSNLSSGGASPLTYAWDFDNDGTIDATDWEPWHRYGASGTYTVSLSVTDASGDTDTDIKPNCLTILPPEGAKMETADGQIRTEFPSGAVTGTAVVTIGSMATILLPDSPQGFKIGDTCFVIMALDESGNEIVTLSQPSVITVRYSEADVVAAGGDPKNLVLAYWDEAAGEWKALKTSVDTANMALSTSTTHLSTWAVLAKTTSASHGLPPWIWVVIGLVAVPLMGAGIHWFLNIGMKLPDYGRH